MSYAKTVVVVTVLLILMTGVAFGVEAQWGVRVGASANFYRGSDYMDGISAIDDVQGLSAENLIRAGFATSIFVELGLAENIAIQPEIGYMRRRGGFEVSDATDTLTGIDNYNVIEFPVYLKPRVEAGNGTLHALVGPQLSYVVGDISVDIELSNGSTTSQTDDVEPDNRFLYGFAIGAGYAGNVDLGGIRSLGFDVIYSRMLNSAIDDQTDPVTGEELESAVLNALGFYLTIGG